MRRETTIVDPANGYWYRLVGTERNNWFKYSWGPKYGNVFRADLDYRGGDKYVLRNRRMNDRYYMRDQTFKARTCKRTIGYNITLRLIDRLLS